MIGNLYWFSFEALPRFRLLLVYPYSSVELGCRIYNHQYHKYFIYDLNVGYHNIKTGPDANNYVSLDDGSGPMLSEKVIRFENRNYEIISIP